MSEEKKRGLFSQLFGPRKCCCGNLKIEEVIEEQPEEAKEQQDQPSAENGQKPSGSCCCGG